MLGRLDPAFLDRIWFPLGEQTKATTRAEAEAAGLPAAGRAESQEACFLAGGDYRSFLERRGLNGEGPILDEEGRELGRHAGVWRFTPGQRRGLGVSSAAPLYALRTDAATSTLVVGPRESLATTSVSARGRLFVDVERVEAKLRYRSPAVAARVVSGGTWIPARARPAGVRGCRRAGRRPVRRRRRGGVRADHQRR